MKSSDYEKSGLWAGRGSHLYLKMDENNRRFPEPNEDQSQEPQPTARSLLVGCSQSSENVQVAVFAGGLPTPEFHLSAIAGAERSFAAGGNSPQIGALHPADAATAAHPVALGHSEVAGIHQVGKISSRCLARLTTRRSSIKFISCNTAITDDS